MKMLSNNLFDANVKNNVSKLEKDKMVFLIRNHFISKLI